MRTFISFFILIVSVEALAQINVYGSKDHDRILVEHRQSGTWAWGSEADLADGEGVLQILKTVPKRNFISYRSSEGGVLHKYSEETLRKLDGTKIPEWTSIVSQIRSLTIDVFKLSSTDDTDEEILEVCLGDPTSGETVWFEKLFEIEGRGGESVAIDAELDARIVKALLLPRPYPGSEDAEIVEDRIVANAWPLISSYRTLGVFGYLAPKSVDGEEEEEIDDSDDAAAIVFKAIGGGRVRRDGPRRTDIVYWYNKSDRKFVRLEYAEAANDTFEDRVDEMLLNEGTGSEEFDITLRRYYLPMSTGVLGVTRRVLVEVNVEEVSRVRAEERPDQRFGYLRSVSDDALLGDSLDIDLDQVLFEDLIQIEMNSRLRDLVEQTQRDLAAVVSSPFELFLE